MELGTVSIPAVMCGIGGSAREAAMVGVVDVRAPATSPQRCSQKEGEARRSQKEGEARPGTHTQCLPGLTPTDH